MEGRRLREEEREEKRERRRTKEKKTARSLSSPRCLPEASEPLPCLLSPLAGWGRRSADQLKRPLFCFCFGGEEMSSSTFTCHLAVRIAVGACGPRTVSAARARRPRKHCRFWPPRAPRRPGRSDGRRDGRWTRTRPRRASSAGVFQCGARRPGSAAPLPACRSLACPSQFQ